MHDKERNQLRWVAIKPGRRAWSSTQSAITGPATPVTHSTSAVSKYDVCSSDLAVTSTTVNGSDLRPHKAITWRFSGEREVTLLAEQVLVETVSSCPSTVTVRLLTSTRVSAPHESTLPPAGIVRVRLLLSGTRSFKRTWEGRGRSDGHKGEQRNQGKGGLHD